MNVDDLTEDDHKARSRFIRNLVQKPNNYNIKSLLYAKKTPMRIVQYWDRLDKLPQDVQECIGTWEKILMAPLTEIMNILNEVTG